VLVRRAAAGDFEAIAELWRQFDHEVPPPTHEGPADEEKELGEVREIIASEVALVAEDDDGAPIGFALARRRAPGFGTLTDLYVGRDARRSGIGTELMREVLERFASSASSTSTSTCRPRTTSRARSTRAGG
jgi:ribosomal protein S18 acetylase RimI-like enzyme